MPVTQNLSRTQFESLLTKVFAPREQDKHVLILVDLPNQSVEDTESWRDRRQIASEWLDLLHATKASFGFEIVELLYYENTGNNNADFPATAYRWNGESAKATFAAVAENGSPTDLHKALQDTDIALVPARFSATAPLKVLAAKYGFRAASMPGFSREMMPALGLDYSLVHEHVMNIKQRLDRAESIEMAFEVAGQAFDFFVDVRHRNGNASSGLIREPGSAWNLPSGEAYIVPYEGELAEKSQTNGILPVQFGDEVVTYQIVANRAVGVTSQGKFATAEAVKLQEEPAYGNIAEIGFGVLEPFGIKPVGVVLLDEKLALHIAFGRSDHFGGATSPASFTKAENVVHIDRIYLPQLQNRVLVKSVDFIYESGQREEIMVNGAYLV